MDQAFSIVNLVFWDCVLLIVLKEEKTSKTKNPIHIGIRFYM